jgi:hypothetical protein
MNNFINLNTITDLSYLSIISKIGKYIDLTPYINSNKIITSDAFILGFLDYIIEPFYDIKTIELTENDLDHIHIIFHNNHIYLSNKFIDELNNHLITINHKNPLNVIYYGFLYDHSFFLNIEDNNDTNIDIYDIINKPYILQLNYLESKMTDSFLNVYNDWIIINNVYKNHPCIFKSINNFKNLLILIENIPLIIWKLLYNYTETIQTIKLNGIYQEFEKYNYFDKLYSHDYYFNKEIDLILKNNPERTNTLLRLHVLHHNLINKYLSNEFIKDVNLNHIIQYKIVDLIIKNTYLTNNDKISMLTTIRKKIVTQNEYLFNIKGVYHNFDDLINKHIGSFFCKAIFYHNYDLAVNLYNENMVNTYELFYNNGYYWSVYDVLYDLLNNKNTNLNDYILNISNFNEFNHKIFYNIFIDIKSKGFKPLVEWKFKQDNQYIIKEIYINHQNNEFVILNKHKMLDFNDYKISFIFFESLMINNHDIVIKLITKNKWLLNVSVDNYYWYHFLVKNNNVILFKFILMNILSHYDIDDEHLLYNDFFEYLLTFKKTTWLIDLFKTINIDIIKHKINSYFSELILNYDVSLFIFIINIILKIENYNYHFIDISRINNIYTLGYLIGEKLLSHEQINYIINNTNDHEIFSLIQDKYNITIKKLFNVFEFDICKSYIHEKLIKKYLS